MELRHLRYFVMTAEEGSVSHAAARLHISQPAISRQLHDLEAELGLKLFTRRQTGIALTPAGNAFLPHARDILRRANAALTAMRQLATPAAPLRIGYLVTALPSFLSDALQRFSAHYPHQEIELRELTPADQIEQLRAGDIDLAIIGNPCPELHAEFQLRIARRIPISAVLPDQHPLARRRSILLSELAHDSWLGLSPKTFPGRNDFVSNLCLQAGFSPNFRAKAHSLSALLALIASGKGVALIPADAASLPHARIRFLPLRRPKAFVEWAVVSPPPTGITARFLPFLCQDPSSPAPKPKNAPPRR